MSKDYRKPVFNKITEYEHRYYSVANFSVVKSIANQKTIQSGAR